VPPVLLTNRIAYLILHGPPAQGGRRAVHALSRRGGVASAKTPFLDLSLFDSKCGLDLALVMRPDEELAKRSRSG